MTITSKLLDARADFLKMDLVKDSQGQFKYLSLGKLIAEIWPVCQKHGLLIQHNPTSTEWGVGVTTRITDADSGEYTEATLITPIAKRDPQGAGSAITYCRRYNLYAMLDIPVFDDDGQAASFSTPYYEMTLKLKGDEREAILWYMEQEESIKVEIVNSAAYGEKVKWKEKIRALENGIHAWADETVVQLREAFDKKPEADAMAVKQLVAEIETPFEKKLIWARLDDDEQRLIGVIMKG
jgi:hypothetical protein